MSSSFPSYINNANSSESKRIKSVKNIGDRTLAPSYTSLELIDCLKEDKVDLYDALYHAENEIRALRLALRSANLKYR